MAKYQLQHELEPGAGRVKDHTACGKAHNLADEIKLLPVERTNGADE